MNERKMKESDLNTEHGNLQHEYNSMKEVFMKEISELKLALEKIRKEEERFRIAYETSPDSININRLSDGMYVSINEGFTSILGYTEADSIGKTSLEMNIWANPEDRSRMVSEVKANGRIKDFESRFLSKDGRIVMGSFSATIIDLDGVPHVLSVVRDITKHKMAEEALAKEKFLVDALMNNLSDHVYFKDLESRFIKNNKAHALSFGLTDPEQIVGKSDFDFFAEHAARQAYEDEQQIIKTGTPILKEEKLTRKDQSDAWFSAIKMPLRDHDDEIIGTFGISRDITEKKRSEFENNAFFEIARGITSTNNLDELLKLIHNSLAKVVYAENCFIALFDKKTGNFRFPYFVDKIDPTPAPTSMGKSCSAYVFNTVKPLLLTQKVFDELEADGYVELIGSNSPSWIGIPLQTPLEVIGVLVLQNYEKENVYSEKDVKFLTSIGSQIAIAIDRRKSEEEIKLKNGLLEAINAEKDKFFSIIAHDLRGPLSSFVGATQILTDEIQSMEIEEIKEIALSMKTSATNIYNLLENLLEWSRLKRGGIDFVNEKLNLLQIAKICVDVLSESSRKKGIDISISIGNEMEVSADRHMLETVIRNLISNAVKFTNRGGKVGITAYSKSEDTIEVKIVDTGVGMSDDLKNKLFMLNEKTSRTGTVGELSTGLGLLLCKEFIEQCGGKIWVESETGKGSTFFFTLLPYRN
jgi:PAS domain S-box-containing protein